MARSLTSGMRAQTLASAMMPALFMELTTPTGIVRAWSGLGTITWNSVDWSGQGALLKVSDVSEVTEVQAAGVSLTLSGIPQAFISLILQSLRRYYPVKLWIGALNASFAVIPDPYLFFSGLVDAAVLSQQGATCSATVTGESKLIRLRIPLERRYTDQDQRIERPYDGGMKFVDFLQDAPLHFSSN